MNTDQALLPFSGRTPRARQASYAGAQRAATTVGRKTARYLELLDRLGPQTDLAAADLLKCQRSSINSIRSIVIDLCLVSEYPDMVPYIEPRTQMRNTRWMLTPKGKAFVTAAA